MMAFDFLTRRSELSALSFAAMFALLLMASGCSTLRANVPRVPSHAISTGEPTTLGSVFKGQAAEHPGLSGFQVVATGHLAFAARAALADAAERTLDLQYYSVGEDLTTDLLLLRIVAAAERGVRVRILLDDIHAPTRLFARRAMAAHPGIQVRLFNPFYFGDTSDLARLGEFIVDGDRLNRRMHNKLWVADNAVAIAGSRNLGDEYFGAHEFVNFHDVDLLAAGPIVNDLSSAFDEYWNSAAAVAFEALAELPDAAEAESVRQGLQARTASCDGVPSCHWQDDGGLLVALRSGSVSLSWAGAKLVYDQPDKERAAMPSASGRGSIYDHPGGSRTQTELLIMSPYFIPTEEGRRHMGEMSARGVRIAVLTNSLASTDAVAAHAGYAPQRAALLREGVELYEVRPEPNVRHPRSHRWRYSTASSLHGKIVVQDRVRAMVGSSNQDPRSRMHNTEAWIVLESAELAADLAELFDEGADLQHAFKVEQTRTGSSNALEWTTEENGKAVRYDVEPMSDLWLRLWRDVLGASIPEHML